jgi:hypothetical protein
MAAAAVAAGGLMLWPSAVSAARESDPPKTTNMPARVHVPDAASPDQLVALLRSVTVLAPRSYGGLTIFPVRASHLADIGQVLTMDEALNRGLLIIEEVGSGSVNQVVARNRSGSYVFMMASEMIGGAKQDRTISEDILLRPHSEVKIPVFCVEAHRWSAPASGAPARFHALDCPAPMAVRRSVRLKQEQSAVWEDVSRLQSRLGASSATGAARSVYESPAIKRDLDPYLSKLREIPEVGPDVIGVVVANGGTIVAADLFCRPALFRHLWPGLLRSYATDALGGRFGKITVSVRDAERFLSRLYDARRTREETPGAGYIERLSGAGVTASALIYKQAVVHLEVFPGAKPLPEPMRRPQMDLNFRRQRLEREAR